YDDLEIVCILRSTTAATSDNVHLYYNNDTTDGNYQSARMFNGNTASTAATRTATPFIAQSAGASSPANYFGEFRARITCYTDTNYQRITLAENHSLRDASTIYTESFAHHWKSTSAITRIQVRTDNHPTDT